MVFKQGMFQIDANMTPDQVANKRAMIAALLPKFGSAKYVGEGVGFDGVDSIGRQSTRQLIDFSLATQKCDPCDPISGCSKRCPDNALLRTFG